MKTPSRGWAPGKEARDVEVEGVGREMADCLKFAEFPVRDSTPWPRP